MKRLPIQQNAQNFIRVMCLGKDNSEGTLEIKGIPRKTIKELASKQFWPRKVALMSDNSFQPQEIIQCQLKFSEGNIFLVNSPTQKCRYVINIKTGTAEFFPYD